MSTQQITLLAEVEEVFENNIKRVNSLIVKHNQLIKINAKTASKPTVQDTDLLRAAVVFSHAALEEAMRGAALIRLLKLEFVDSIAELPLLDSDNTKPTDKIKFVDLYRHKEKTIEFFLQESLKLSILRNSTFNNTTDICNHFVRLKLNGKPNDATLALLATFFERRHLIVHHSDRRAVEGKGSFIAKTIKENHVNDWLTAVKDTVQLLFVELRTLEIVQ
jgi:RiboL-PSP-HEPN